MTGKLTVVDGPDKERTFALTPGEPLLIGRGTNTDTRLTDPEVSRLHCQIEVEGDQVVVRDNGSAGGTFINGRRIDRQPLLECQIIRIGGTTLLFERVSIHEEDTLSPARAAGARPLPDRASEQDDLTGKTLLHYEVGRLLVGRQSSIDG